MSDRNPASREVPASIFAFQTGAFASTSDASHSNQNENASASGQGEEDKKPKRSRNRTPSSCVNCRKKKLRCNRAAPCNQCTQRNEVCRWEDATPLFDSRTEHDADELRQQVLRLEGLVKYLTSRPSDLSMVPSHLRADPLSILADNNITPLGDFSPDPTDVQISSSSHSSVSPPLPPPSYTSVRSSSRRDSPPPEQFPPPASVQTVGDDQNVYKLDLRANDLCEALSQLSIRSFIRVEGSGHDSWAPGGRPGSQFVQEAREFMDALPQRFGLQGNGLTSIDFSGLPMPSASNGLSTTHLRTPEASESGSPPPPLATALSPSLLSDGAFHRSAPPLSEVLKFLPKNELAVSAYRYFSGYVSWYSHPVHLATFESQWKAMRVSLSLDPDAQSKAIDPFFVATFLAVLAMGLAMMPEKRALRDGFPKDKDKMVDHWLEGAMLALKCGKFLDNPSVEAVRAVVIICTYYVFMSTGESSGPGMDMLALSVQVAMSLGLHRDPDKTPSRYTFFEAEERRRLFWNLFMLCILSSSSLGRTWAVFDLNGVDTKLPLDCHDDEIVSEPAARAGTEARRRKGEETPMTSLLVKMRLAMMVKKINDRAFGIHPVAYSVILGLDRELREFEDSVPPKYQLRFDGMGVLVRNTAHVTVTEMRACMIQISISAEFIRLHRPWIVLASENPEYQYSRDQAIKYSKLLLAVYRSPSCAMQTWGGLTYKATNAAIVLAVDILTFPLGSEAPLLRATIRATAEQMERNVHRSTLCRKGARVIRFLLEKDALMSIQREDVRESKRSRFTDVSIASQSRLAAALHPHLDPIQSYPPGSAPYRHYDIDLPRKQRFDDTSLSPNYYPRTLPQEDRSFISTGNVASSRELAPLPHRYPPSYDSTSSSIRLVQPSLLSNLDAGFAFDFMVPSIPHHSRTDNRLAASYSLGGPQPFGSAQTQEQPRGGLYHPLQDSKRALYPSALYPPYSV